MAYTTINKPNTQMNPVLYTGNGGTQSITGVNFQPDWVWMKSRTNTENHTVFDVIRGVTKYLKPNETGSEVTNSNSLTSFDSDGFSLGSNNEQNSNGQSFASWNWKAGGTAVSNTDGSITSSVSANTTNGFSIVSYTGTGANATVGHGLGVAPKMVIVKNRDGTQGWGVYHASLGNTKFLILNTNAAEGTASTFWNNTTPTSSVFSIGTSGWMNDSSNNYIAYCFADVKGFSKMGSYTGNGSTDGTFIYTGFSPSFIMFKNASVTESWTILDLKRASVPNANPNANVLWPNDNFAEYDETQGIDFLSNGFKVRESATGFNGSGNTIIYMAFAENPLVGTNNVPATAR